MIKDFLMKYKVHLIYGGMIVLLFSFLVRKPSEITKTKIVDRNIVKTQKQYVDRVIVKKEASGTVTTTTEHVTTAKQSTDKSKFVSSTHISYLSRYSLDIQYPVTFTTIPTNLEAKKFIITAGYRLFNSPVFVTLGTNVGLDSILIGVRYEF